MTAVTAGPEFEMVKTGGGSFVKVFRDPQPVHLECPDCRWVGMLNTRVPAPDNQFPCPSGCGFVKESAK